MHHHPSRRRAAARRRRCHLRNAVWFAWLRRPLPVALRAMARLARDALSDFVARQALADALAGLGW